MEQDLHLTYKLNKMFLLFLRSKSYKCRRHAREFIKLHRYQLDEWQFNKFLGIKEDEATPRRYVLILIQFVKYYSWDGLDGVHIDQLRDHFLRLVENVRADYLKTNLYATYAEFCEKYQDTWYINPQLTIDNPLNPRAWFYIERTEEEE
jgi:hypothetical protein